MADKPRSSPPVDDTRGPFNPWLCANCYTLIENGILCERCLATLRQAQDILHAALTKAKLNG